MLAISPGIVLFCSSIITPALGTLAQALDISEELSTGVFSMYVGTYHLVKH